jgi:protein gp37
MSSKIEWTDETWNPVTGCTEVSPGCDHCYAKTFAERWRGTAGHHFENGFDLTLRPERLDQPMKWRRPRRVFVNSMSDLFHVGVPSGFIGAVFHTMCVAEEHTFQILTKRPERMRRVVPEYYASRRGDNPLRNVWLGVSVESNDYAWRVDMLRETPAAVRFLSIEPMLGPIDKVSFEGIDWVIVGGESGHGARPMNPAWVRDVRDRCVAAGIPFFFKQWGEHTPHAWTLDGTDFPNNMARVGKARAGRELAGRTWDEFPAVRA